MITPQYLTEQDVANLTKLSLSKLRQDRFKNQGIPYYKIGRAVRYKLSDLQKFMDQHLVMPTTYN